MATTINGSRWGESFKTQLIGLRRSLRNTAAAVQTLKGQYNALTAAQKTELRDALTAQGFDVPALITEVNALDTLAITVLSTVTDTPDLI